MSRENILLKEYGVCQQDINSRASRFWTIVGIFIPFNTALLGWIINWITKTFNLDIDYIWGLLLVLLFSIGMIVILSYLMTWLERVNSFIRVSNKRMQEIEKVLGMRKNCIADVLDNHWDKMSEEEKENLSDLHDKHVKKRETTCFKIIFYTLISLWGVIILTTFIVIALTLVDYLL